MALFQVLTIRVIVNICTPVEHRLALDQVLMAQGSQDVVTRRLQSGLRSRHRF